ANHYDRDMQRLGPPLDVMNGEFVKIISIRQLPETRTTSIFVKEGGDSVKKLFSITYQDVMLQLQNGELYECKIITNLLSSKEKGLSISQIKARYVDFCIRHPNLESDTLEFKFALQSDPYMNALMVKYGYAITCHKAQGGEWDTAVVDFSGVVLCKNGLRWIYTAVTRVKKMLYGVNMPDVKPMDMLKINTITQMNRLPNDWPQLPLCSVEELLEGSAFHVIVTKELPYRHRYTIFDGIKTYQADMIYDKQGTITSIQCACEELKSLLSAPHKAEYPPLIYTPSTMTAQQLYETMVEACEQSGTTIVGVKEYMNYYHILYFLHGDDKITLDFYFNSDGFFTYAAPMAKKGLYDNKLNKLLTYLDDNAKK
ncbi:MAG: ATP-binding domain-containing protein, partial [Paludibacteraceae bacterium]